MKKILVFSTILFLCAIANRTYGQAASKKAAHDTTTDQKVAKIYDILTRKRKPRPERKPDVAALAAQKTSDTAHNYQSPVNTSGGTIMYVYGGTVTVNNNTNMYTRPKAATVPGSTDTTAESDTTLETEPQTISLTPAFRLIRPTSEFEAEFSSGQNFRDPLPKLAFEDVGFQHKIHGWWENGYKWWQVWKMFSRNQRLKHKICSKEEGMAEAIQCMALIKSNKYQTVLSDTLTNVMNLKGQYVIRIESKLDPDYHQKFWIFDLTSNMHACISPISKKQKMRLVYPEWKRKK